MNRYEVKMAFVGVDLKPVHTIVRASGVREAVETIVAGLIRDENLDVANIQYTSAVRTKRTGAKR